MSVECWTHFIPTEKIIIGGGSLRLGIFTRRDIFRDNGIICAPGSLSSKANV